jgi:hypothetical protein
LEKDPHRLSDGFNIYQYVNNEPMNSLDLTGLWTVSVGGYGTAGAPGIVGSGGASFNFDGHGNISLTVAGGAGGRAGTPGASGALHFGATDGRDVGDLTGKFVQYSVGGAAGEHVGGTVYFGPNDIGETVEGGGVDIRFGLGVGLDTQVTYTEELWRGDIWDFLDPWGMLPCH